MATFSFDIVSTINKGEMNNVFMQVGRELASRFDFKGTPAAFEWLEDKTGFKIIGNSEWQIESILDIVRKKLVARGQSSKSLDLTKEIIEGNMKAIKEVPFKEGLDQDKARHITKLIRENYPKVKTQIQGDTVRVMSGSKNDLQTVMQFIKEQDFDFTIQFINFR